MPVLPGDSQLARVHAAPPNPAEPEMLVEVLDSFDNLGPIVDFVVVDLDRQGQGQVWLGFRCSLDR